MFVSSTVYRCCHPAKLVKVAVADTSEYCDTVHPNISRLIYTQLLESSLCITVHNVISCAHSVS